MATAIKIALISALVEVALIDVPVAHRISLSGSTPVASVDIDVDAADQFTVVDLDDGGYSGSVQGVRADGTLIGAPVSFTYTVTSAPTTVTASVATGVNIGPA